MDKRTEINNALKAAIRNKDTVATSTLRLMLAALKDRDIAARGQGNTDGVNETEILSMLQSMIKQRQESIETYEKAGRPELAEREAKEIEVIRTFLPKQMGEDEMRGAVDDLIRELNVHDIKEMGKVMAALKTRYAGQLDMTRASGVVKERLAG